MSVQLIQLLSSEWLGHYVQFGNTTKQRIVLEFADGLIRGDGVDRVSPFTIDAEVKMGWIKNYQHGHCILYCGYLRDEVISGEWELPGLIAALLNWLQLVQLRLVNPRSRGLCQKNE